jgi:hypothetical protein
VIRAARGFVQDVGKAAARKSQGLVELAQRSEANGERDCHKLLADKYNLSLPVRKSLLETSAGFSLPVLRIRDWAKFLINGNHSHILVGLKKPDWCREGAILKKFWQNFQLQRPEHPVFELARQKKIFLQKTFPMVFHGDEGRGRKHTPCLVLNFHSVLGRGLQNQERKKPFPYLKMVPNFDGHTLSSRFLLTSVPKVLYTGRNAEVFQELMRLVSEEMQHMFFEGVEDETAGRGKFHMTFLNIVGDWPWLVDSGNLARSYRNVQKQKNQTKPLIGICHMCAASRHGFNCDFEQINTLQPQWLSTMNRLNVFGNGGDLANFSNVPHVAGRLAEFWAFDLFHTVHLGVCKAFLGSCLVLLSELQPEPNVDDRFDSLTDLYLSWCKSAGRRPWLHKLSKELVGGASSTAFPNGIWHKGALSTTLMDWVQVRYELEGSTWPGMLQEAGAACVSLNGFLRGLYSHDVWLEPRVARMIGKMGFDFLVRYARLAHMAWREGRLLWVLQPKHHSLHHLVIGILFDAVKGPVLSTICLSTQADEDFVGRPSRLSRRVTPKVINSCTRVVERYLVSAFSHWVDAGFIVSASGSRSAS